MIIVIPLYPVFWALHAIHRGLRRIFPNRASAMAAVARMRFMVPFPT